MNQTKNPKQVGKKLSLSRETLRTLSDASLRNVVGGVSEQCQPGDSDFSCDRMCQTGHPI